MGRVFSWKLDDYKYGYIVPRNGSHISERITGDTALSDMAQIVKGWDRETYTEKFNELNEEVFSVFHVSIPGNADDYFGNDQLDSSYVILTGKDGKNGNFGLSEEDLKAIENAVSKKINLAMSEIEQNNKSLRIWVNDKTLSSIASAKTITDNTIEQIETINQSLKDELENAEETMSIAASLFDFNGHGVTKEKLINAIANSNSALTLASVADSKATYANDMIVNITNDLGTLQNEQQKISNKVLLMNDTMLINFGKVSKKIDDMEEEVADIKVSSQYQQASDSDQDVVAGSTRKIRKKNTESPNSILTNITQNNDGTYTSVVKIGKEVYFINVLPTGETFTDENIKNGLTLSKNGFRYINNKAEMLISDGVIKLSNKNGGGSIEINDDGVFINGKKSK